MKQINYAGLTFTVPETWTNQSTLVFAMPPAELNAPFALNKQQSHSTANVTISREAAQGLNAQDFLSARMKTIPSIFPGFEQMDAALQHDSMPYVQYRVPADSPFIQWVCAKKIGERMVCITGTALEPDFDRVKELFRDTAVSIEDG